MTRKVSAEVPRQQKEGKKARVVEIEVASKEI